MKRPGMIMKSSSTEFTLMEVQLRNIRKQLEDFAGELQGTVIGKLNDTAKGATVKQLRSVVGGKHTEGVFRICRRIFCGRDIRFQSSGGQTTILGILTGLIQRLYWIPSVLMYMIQKSSELMIRILVEAKEGGSYGYVNTPLFLGNAGGFGGSMCNGSVKNSSVRKSS